MSSRGCHLALEATDLHAESVHDAAARGCGTSTPRLPSEGYRWSCPRFTVVRDGIVGPVMPVYKAMFSTVRVARLNEMLCAAMPALLVRLSLSARLCLLTPLRVKGLRTVSE